MSTCSADRTQAQSYLRDHPSDPDMLDGAAEGVHGEFEVGMEFVNHRLHRFGAPSQEAQALQARRR